MAKLNQIIGAILTEITKAQATSDAYSRNLKSSYREDPFLKLLSVPRTEVKNVTIDLKFAILKDNFNTSIPLLLGQYEYEAYEGRMDEPESRKNYYVTISQVNDTTLKWSNNDGVSWMLFLTDDKTKLDVGSDCPYFKDGYKQATVVWEGGQVSGLISPFQELYSKSNDVTASSKDEQNSIMNVESMEIEVNTDCLEKLPDTVISSISIKLDMTSV
jgi:hypothetical protein